MSSKRLWCAGHQLNESSVGLQRREFGHVGNFVPIFHALFQSLPQIHYRLLVFALLGVGLGEEEVELRHLFDTALLEQLAVLAVVLGLLSRRMWSILGGGALDEVRTDTGAGACEVMLVSDVALLSP